jgi:hypothetical protein
VDRRETRSSDRSTLLNTLTLRLFMPMQAACQLRETAAIRAIRSLTTSELTIRL